MFNFKSISRGFAAGAIGGVANVVALAIFGKLGITAAMGIHMPPPALPAFLYTQMVWGGLWGLLFVTPLMKDSWWQRGIVIGLLASVAALFYFIPRGPAGMAGLNAGTLTPLLVVIVNTVWGLVASWWYEKTA